MSSDAQTTAPPPVAGEAEVKQKKSMKERMAFLDKSGQSMDKVPGLNKIPRSLRIVAVIIVLILLVAIIAVAWPSGPAPSEKPTTIDPAKLEDFSDDLGPTDGQLTEYQDTSVPLDQIMPANGSYLVDSIEATLTWTDEPDQTWAGRTRVNSPDSFQLVIDIGNGNFTVESDMTPNDAGSKQGSVSISLDMAATNFTYLVIGNASGDMLPDDVTDLPVVIHIYMGEAGDLYASGPALFKLNDTGNTFSLMVSVSGKQLPS